MLTRLAVLSIVVLSLACGSSDAEKSDAPSETDQPLPVKPTAVVPSVLPPPPFKATDFASDVVIPSKRAIQVVGWSPDGQRLAYASTDQALNLAPEMEELFSSDLTGTAVSDEGRMAGPSLLGPYVLNPHARPAAAWTRGGLIREGGTPGAYGVGSATEDTVKIPSLPLYSIPVDREGNAYLLAPDGTWQRGDGSVISQLMNPIDEGAFSVSPDGTEATYARDRDDGQRDLVLTDTAGNETIIGRAPFIAVDGWKADSSAVAIRTGISPRSSWRTDVAWFVLDPRQTQPVAPELDGLFLATVLPSPTDANMYLVAGVVIGTDVAHLNAWYLTTDGGASCSRFGLGAAGSAAWSPDGASIAYTTAKVEDRGTRIMQLHVARLK